MKHALRQRPANRAGETTEQCEIGDWPARLAAIHAAERGEDCIVKAGAHAKSNQHPGQQIDRQRVGKTHKREAGGIK
jgi:hypothetical protein